MCSTALPVNSRSIRRRAIVPISSHGASTAICGRNFFASILRTRGIDGLIAMLNTKANALSARAS